MQRIQILLEQDRFPEAERQARLELATETDRPGALCLLAVALLGQKRYAEARQTAEQAIGEDPERPHSFYVYSLTLSALEEHRKAQDAIENALRMHAEHPDFLCRLGQVLLDRGKPDEAMKVIERGLGSDPDSTSLRHARTQALIQMRQLDAADESALDSVGMDPEDATGHAQLGYLALRRNDIETAQQHFTEALRLDPTHSQAQAGLLVVLKSKRFLFRMALAYSNWMRTQSPGVRVGILFGGMFAVRAVRSTAGSNPGLAPFAAGLTAIYLVFVYFTWTIDPLTNLLLRLDPVGRLLLSADERRGANWVGGLVAAAVLCAVLGLAFDALWVFAGVFALLVLPVAGTAASEGKARRVSLAVTVLLGCVGLGGAVILLGGGDGAGLLGLFGIGVLAFTWVRGTTLAREN